MLYALMRCIKAGKFENKNGNYKKGGKIKRGLEGNYRLFNAQEFKVWGNFIEFL